MPEFKFIQDGHLYLLDGNPLVSVTTCLPYNYMKDNTDAMLKGTYVHEMARLWIMGNLDEEILDPVLKPYLEALKGFMRDSAGMGICGVIDIKSGSPHPCTELQISAYVELVNNGIPMNVHPEVLVSGLEVPYYHPTYLYAGTPDIVIGSKPIREGHVLYLRDNGNYSLTPVKNIRKNFEMFLQFLNTTKWKKEKGLL
jgi:hypothetical protein